MSGEVRAASPFEQCPLGDEEEGLTSSQGSHLYELLAAVAGKPTWETLLLEGARVWEAMGGGALACLHLIVLTDEDEWQNEVYLYDASKKPEKLGSGPDPLPRLGVPRHSWFDLLSRGRSFLWFEKGRTPNTALVPLFREDVLAGLWMVRLQGVVGPEAKISLGAWGRLMRPVANLVAQRLHEEAVKVCCLEENCYFRERERRHYLFKELICESPAMQVVYEEVNARVELDTPVLITGEAGTGKELITRALHHLSARSEGMLISVHCGQSDEGLLDFELFGCVASELAGAVAPRQGVFELARDGTVFLDEIDLLSPLMQGKIVRMLKEREVRRIGDAVGRSVNARLIASTHRDLQTLVDEGRLRHDLYLALSGHILEVPPLRMRGEDIMPLGRTFLKNFAHRYGASCRGFDEALQVWMETYPWPGNVRELQTFVEAAVLKCQGDEELRLEKLMLSE